MKEKVSIIMVTYNAINYVKKSIDSIERFTKFPYELIVVDNNSNKELKEYLKRKNNKHKVILNKKNNLFAAANNQGIEISDPQSKYLLLLNPDIEVLEHDWLKNIINVINSKSNIGIAGLKHNYKPVAPLYGALDGWCFMFKREVLNQIGLFDSKNFPWNGSPNDYTIRAFKQGWIYKYINDNDFIIHYEDMSRKENDKYKDDIPYDYYALLKKHGIKPVKKNKRIERLRKKICNKFKIMKRFYEV